MPTYPHSLALPGLTFASKQKLYELLEKNHVFHIYFDGLKHNHVAHNLIAIYSMGATPEQLQSAYDQHSQIQKPPLPLHFDAPHSSLLDPVTFLAHLGDPSYYPDYLAFFDREIQLHGLDQTFQTFYGDTSSKPAAHMRFQGLNGVLHGLIHVGYGLELDHPLLLAEGLALCAVEYPDYDPTVAAFAKLLFDPTTATTSATTADTTVIPSGEKQDLTLLEVFDQLYQARSTFVQGSTGLDYKNDHIRLGTHKLSSLVESICSQWHVKADPVDINAKLHELSQLTFKLYAGTKKTSLPIPEFDFFLMHTLTSGFFLPVVIDKFKTVEIQALMLQAIARWYATEYVVAGLPKIHSYEDHPSPLPSDTLSWSDIIKEAIEDEDEHVAKVVRALIKLDVANGTNEPSNAYLKAARDTIGFRMLQRKDTTTILSPPFWYMSGLGYKK